MDNHNLMRQRPIHKTESPLKYAYQWMSIAYMMAYASSAKRRRVGAVVVTPSMAVFTGYNGTAPGAPNTCECDGITTSQVYHAEENAFDKMGREGVSAKGSLVFLTLSPCINCARRIAGLGAVGVYYLQEYRDRAGIEHLMEMGIGVGAWSDILGNYFVPMDLTEEL